MDILKEILVSLQSEDRVMLATILSTDGSTPASALSKMLVKENGKKWIGTVGGGCVEGDVLEEAVRLFGTERAKTLTFQLNETNIDQGLICGGNLDVFIEPLTKRDLAIFEQLKSIRDEGNDSVLATLVSAGGKIQGKYCVSMEAEWKDGMMGWWKKIEHDQVKPMGELLTEAVTKTHRRNETQRLPLPEAEVILEPVTGRPGLIIFGGGHVSKYVSRAAAMTGFRVTIIDDRPEYANADRFPEADATLALDFVEAVRQLEIKPSTYIVILTRGHRSDEEILSLVISSPAKYIGMIGSRRKVLTTYEHLAERGVSVELLKRVHAPIGIEIGAATAEEIGISVAAQLIAVRRGETERQTNKSDAMRDVISRMTQS
jgi:xanthine dehydrogenase accessory factor